MEKVVVERLITEAVGVQNLKINEPMKNHTSFKIGGPADILATPNSIEQLADILEICRANNIPFFVMGNGSNLIVMDKGIRGVVIKLFDNFNKCEVENDIIEVEAGALLSRIANIALEHELKGLEFASGIPGTLGGAVTMNAGAYCGEMKDVVIKTQYMGRNGDIKEIEGKQHQFGYRTSFIQKTGGIVLKSVLKLSKGSKFDIKALMDDLNKRRKEKQPLHLPSAGSVFKRPEGFFTGQLIEQCGLKGYQIGGAQVSDLHCGFITNVGDASAQDVVNLIKHVQYEVKSKFNVELQTEVKFVGEE